MSSVNAYEVVCSDCGHTERVSFALYEALGGNFKCEDCAEDGYYDGFEV